MCGIIGILSTNKKIETDIFKKMRDSLTHRGPDDEGLYLARDGSVALGHRRLSIIDLSSRGKQPLKNEDGTVWVVYNGEIYNYQSLRQELEELGHIFHSNTDTEVIVHAYEAWGESSIKRFRGMFAFALWDEKRKIMLLARDRLGIKPLFYYWDGRVFIFSSEIKGILPYPELNRDIDQTALFDYLTYLYIPPPKTIYSHIRKLKEGHILRYENEALQEHKYWDIDFGEKKQLTGPQAEELLLVKLKEAVQSHMISDVPVGVLLSGGFDSSTVTSLASTHSSERLCTCTVGFDVAEYSETRFARIIADRFRTQHYESTVGIESLQESLSQVIRLYDEPYADSSAIPTYEVCRIAREHVKVALSGDGGDEVFIGYPRYSTWLKREPWIDFPAFIKKLFFKPLSILWPEERWGYRFIRDIASEDTLEPFAHLVQIFKPEEKRLLLDSGFAKNLNTYDDYWYFRQFWNKDLDPLTRAQYLDLKTYLPSDILTKVDRASMAVSLEVRPPLLDHELIEFVFKLPSALRFKNEEKKYLLKKTMKDILPSEILTRGKKGFSLPWNSWKGKTRSWVDQFLLNGECIKREILNRQVFRDNLPLLSGNRLWTFIMLEQWLRGN
jgi:asparagine synthase (glutamine-hydrolysing)